MLKATTHLEHSYQGKGTLTCLPRFDQHHGFRFLTIQLVQHLNAAEWLLKLGPEHTVLHINVLLMHAVVTYSIVNGLLQLWWVPCQASEEVSQIRRGPSPVTPPLRCQHQIVACLHPSHRNQSPFHANQSPFHSNQQGHSPSLYRGHSFCILQAVKMPEDRGGLSTACPFGQSVVDFAHSQSYSRYMRNSNRSFRSQAQDTDAQSGNLRVELLEPVEAQHQIVA